MLRICIQDWRACCMLYREHRGGYRGRAKGAVAPLSAEIQAYKMNPSQCSPLKVGSVIKVITKIHQKCCKLLSFVLHLGQFVGVVVKSGHALKFSHVLCTWFISSSPLQNVCIHPWNMRLKTMTIGHFPYILPKWLTSLWQLYYVQT